MIPFSLNEAAAPPSFVFRVVGLFRMGFNEYDTRLAYVSLEDAHRLESARGSVFGIELRFSDPHLALSQVKEVKRRLDAPYRVIDWKELNHNLFTALIMQKVIISMLLLLIIIVAAFNIIASLTMIVLSKVREIAILKSMGARSAMIARIFLVGGTTVGGVGTGLGIVYGLLICMLARLYGYPARPQGLSHRPAARGDPGHGDRGGRRDDAGDLVPGDASTRRCAPAASRRSRGCARSRASATTA